MRVLFLGEIVGRCGIGVVKKTLKPFRTEKNIDFVIANGEGATSGFGLGFINAQTIKYNMGVDVFTLGEKTYFKMDMVEGISKKDWILRPYNYPEDAPGRGVRYFNVGEKKLCVINALGMMGFTQPHLNNPFLTIEGIVDKAKSITNLVVVMFHAQATAEKLAIRSLLQGRVSAVLGTHTKVLTADSSICDGTAYITDLGRCGASDSVGGFDTSAEIRRIRTLVPARSIESWNKPELQGLLVDFDTDTGKAISFEVVKTPVDVSRPEDSKAFSRERG